MMDSSKTAAADGASRKDSISHASNDSQTAQDYITSQLSLEAEAREALPYQFDTCTKPLGPLRQSVYACLTCTPPPASPHQRFNPAGVCYSCSISCHGEHSLVELFTKRNFVCDCGTTRYGNSGTPCDLRVNPENGRKGGVTGEEARIGNKYDQNFQGKFCGCGEEYDPEKEKGTMFQCLGLGTVEDGGCGEDWWHPECLMGVPRVRQDRVANSNTDGILEIVKEEDEIPKEQSDNSNEVRSGDSHDEAPLPKGFPAEDDFEYLLCYKCINAFPWIKKYAGMQRFITVKHDASQDSEMKESVVTPVAKPDGNKRKAEDDLEDEHNRKRSRSELEQSSDESPVAPSMEQTASKHAALPPAPEGDISLCLPADFREHLCRCPECFPQLAKHPQLLEEEDAYEPPLSESDVGENGQGSVAGRSVNSGSLLERGEAALSSMDRVRAIEGVIAYNHVRDKVKAFLQPFAESGQAVGAEDIKAYFAKLRGDEQAMRKSAVQAGASSNPDHRREQDGY